MNHLRELIETPFFDTCVISGCDLQEAELARQELRDLQDFSTRAICFHVGDFSPLVDFPLYKPLCNMPFNDIWIEGDALDHIIGIRATQSESGFKAACWRKNQSHWTFVGVYWTDQFPYSEARYFTSGDPEKFRFMRAAVGSFLTALNCQNVKRTEHVPSRLKQTMRAQKGKKPLFSYWTLDLVPHAEDGQPHGGTHASPRLHLRRGHPRKLASGKYIWVQPCVVGNKAAGIVHKDYRLSS